ncbi:RidA family protein [Arcobacter sp.]|uniref:RidA family protein n=1 Tax=unclassified Arcobacter TaxID=2593671 RepID=UPI003AFFDA0C
MKKITINPKNLYDCTSFGMSQVVVDPDTKFVFISGQVDWSLEFKVSSNTLLGQTISVLEKLKIALEEANSSIENILQLRIYIKGDVSTHMESLIPVLTDFLGDSYPALTGIGVESLAAPDLLVEIETISKQK